MTWFIAAMLSAAILGMVVVFDSYFISKRMPSLQSFLIIVFFVHIISGVTLNIIEPFPAGIGAAPYIVAVLSGIIRAVSVLIMLYMMRSEEVSRIIPVTHTFPIFVAILAAPLLDEALNGSDWLAICITVAGAALISVRWDSQSGGARLGKSFMVLMGASFLMGVANTASKYALEDISFWNMYTINAYCFCAVFLLYSLRPGVIRELWALDRRNLTASLVFLNESVAFVGIVLSFWAMEQGPVSLASTVLSTRPAFVFLYAILLTRILPAVLEERLSKGVLITKTISIALIITGVTIINL